MRRIIQRLAADPAVRLAVVIFVVLRLLTFVIAARAAAVHPADVDWSADPIYYVRDSVFITQGAARSLIEPWYRWDTGWYLYIANQGYSQNATTIIFPPLYPLTIRLMSVLTGGDYLIAALLVSNIACVIALVLLYKLVEEDYGRPVAFWTLITMACFLSAFYLVAGYTESLFLAFALGAWLLFKRQRYGLSALLAFLAALTRSQGWALAVPFGYMAYVAPHGGNWITAARYYLRAPLKLIRPLPAVIAGVVGTGAYVLGMQILGYGSVEAQFSAQPWNVQVVAPWQSIINAVHAILIGTANPWFGNDLLNVGCLVLVMALGVLMIWRLKPEYTLFTWITVAFILMRSDAQFQVHGMPRYVLAIFPVFIMISVLFQRKTYRGRMTRMILLAGSAAIQIVLLVVFAWGKWVS